MLTECAECDRAASAFHGVNAYCMQHLEDAALANPDAHSCPQCNITQPRHVMWERKAPCQTCQDQDKRRKEVGRGK